jgi:hypothetical protein
MKTLIQTIKTKLSRKRPVYGPKIFQERSWVSQRVEDEQYKRFLLLGR